MGFVPYRLPRRRRWRWCRPPRWRVPAATPPLISCAVALRRSSQVGGSFGKAHDTGARNASQALCEITPLKTPPANSRNLGSAHCELAHLPQQETGRSPQVWVFGDRHEDFGRPPVGLPFTAPNGLITPHRRAREVAVGKRIAASLGRAPRALHRLVDAAAVERIGLIGGVADQHDPLGDDGLRAEEAGGPARDGPALGRVGQHLARDRSR